jgi:hypothetical protein
LERVKRLPLALFLLTTGLAANGQMIGNCPQIKPRRAQAVRRPRGVLVDQNLAVIPKAKVILQRPNKGKFDEIASLETDQPGKIAS